MEKPFQSFASLTDRELLAQVKSLAAKEAESTATLIASLAELDERRLYLAEGFSSLFAYCVRVLHLTEHAAYNRIEVARTARQWPIIFQMIADGSVTLTAVHNTYEAEALFGPLRARERPTTYNSFQNELSPVYSCT